MDRLRPGVPSTSAAGLAQTASEPGFTATELTDGIELTGSEQNDHLQMGWLALIAGASLVLGVWAFIQGASVFGVLSSLVAAFATRKAYTSRSSREVWQLRPGEASLIAKRDNAIISVNAIIVVHVVFTTTYRDHGMSENVILIDANGVQHSLFSNIADVRGLATVAASALALPLTFRDEA